MPSEFYHAEFPTNSPIQFDEAEFLRLKDIALGLVEKTEELTKKPEDAKVGTTYVDFISSFRRYIPDIKLIKSPLEVESFDLIIVPGGEDISPELYGESNKYSYVNTFRDNIEVPIVKRALHLRKKIFGSCRGHQLINVLAGGNLYQDFIDELGMDRRHSVDHSLENIQDSTIQKYFGEISVVSMHHQAVKQSPLKVTSTYKGIIESTSGRNIITTQFHPEFADNSQEFFNFLRAWSVSK